MQEPESKDTQVNFCIAPVLPKAPFVERMDIERMEPAARRKTFHPR